MSIFDAIHMQLSDEQFIRQQCKKLNPIPTSELKNLEPLSGIRCIVFDIYGTLLISAANDIPPANEHVFREILDFAKIESATFESFAKLISEKNKQSKQQGIDHPEVDIISIWREFLLTHNSRELTEKEIHRIALAYELQTNPVWPMPHAASTLAVLEQHGMPLGIVSNAQFYTQPIIESLFGSPLHDLGFSQDLCHFSYRYGYAKPDISIFQKLVDSLATKSITPKETLYVGNDALKDVHTASLLGFKTALFAGDNRSLRLHEDQHLNPPDISLTELKELTEILLLS